MTVSCRAWRGLACLALAGMAAGCQSQGSVRLVADDLRIDAVWRALATGDLDAAAEGAALIEADEFRARALADVTAARSGRSAVLVAALESPGWLAARFLASPARARAWLAEVRSRDGDGPAARLEEVRRAGSTSRREALAQQAMGQAPGGAEAWALLTESLLARQAYAELETQLVGEPPTGRLRLVQRQLHAFTGRIDRATRDLLDDLREEQAVPASIVLLQQLFEMVPQRDLEEQALPLLARAAQSPGTLMRRVAQGCQLSLLRRAGRLAEAEALVAAGAIGPMDELPVEPTPSERAAEERWARRRLASDAVRSGWETEAVTVAARVDADPQRVGSADLQRLRLLHEWSLTARDSYSRPEDDPTLDEFLADLDHATEGLGSTGRLQLASMPRVEYGVLGSMLDTAALREALPGAFVVAGQGLGMPPELAVYDVLDVREVSLPEPPGGTYAECLVAGLRVPGYLASQGARFAGAGLDRFVFLDADQVLLEARGPARVATEPLQALPAHDLLSRRALDEPLDAAERLWAAARAEAGAAWVDRVRETLSVHERQHIVDVRNFLERSLAGQLLDIVGAGLLPGAVRAEVERRAQLAAMRLASDPRIALAQAVECLPVEGERGESEHARGYAALVAELIELLDEGDWPGSQPIETWGIDRRRVLLQQLPLLPPEVLRELALAIPLD